jgi:hypothetical protein
MEITNNQLPCANGGWQGESLALMTIDYFEGSKKVALSQARLFCLPFSPNDSLTAEAAEVAEK